MATSTSQLFVSARDSLGSAEQTRLRAFEGWLESVRSTAKGDPVDGAQLMANLRAEAHLTGGRAFGVANALGEYLAGCAKLQRARKPAKRLEEHISNCVRHSRKGLPIPAAHLPAQLLSYSTSRTLAATLIKAVLGLRALEQFKSGMLSPDEAFEQIAEEWADISDLVTAKTRLGKEDFVWATFRRKKGTPRHDAKGMAEALGLPPKGRDALLFEFTYSRDRVLNHRFPTVADAALIDRFRPAPEQAPNPRKRATLCGWTKPTGSWPSQPELIHDNAALSVLSRPPRFVGRIP